MSKYPKLVNYVSEIDQFIQNHDKNHPFLSLSQQKEQQKYRRIYELRDGIKTSTYCRAAQLWEDF